MCRLLVNKNIMSSKKRHDFILPKEVSNFVTPIHSILTLFNLQKVIGRGVSGCVFLGQSTRTHKQYALKQMSRSDPNNYLSFIREIRTLNALTHPNLIQINDAFASSRHYYISTEYCHGSSLFQHISKVRRLSEKHCASVVKRLLGVVDYMHSNHTVHRDLKLSNIVFTDVDIHNSKLKLIDFGESERISDLNEEDGHVVGSLNYLPPETTQSRTKMDLFAGDMWAIGVITYVLLHGVFPFRGTDVEQMMQCIQQSKVEWNEKIQITTDCKAFIQSLLNKDRTKRSTAKQALQHPWILDDHQETDENKMKTTHRHSLEVSDEDLHEITNDIDTILAEIDAERSTQDVKWNNELEALDETDIDLILDSIDTDTHHRTSSIK
eukprot:121348_1